MQQLMQFTTVFDKLVEAAINHRYLILYGGSSSSKSVSIMQYLTLYALKYKNKRITLSAESLPVIKKTLFADWKDIVMGEMFDPGSFNKTEMVYTFPTGTVFNFIPADDPARWHGLRQDIVYFDELYNVKQTIYDQADIRTKEKVISSFNPTSEFWVQKNFEDDLTAVLHSTYKDNQFVPQSVIDALEKRLERDKNFYDVYVLGLFGSLKGLIFKEGINWKLVDKMPENPNKHIHGLDFGFSNNPAALIDIMYHNGEFYLDELLYKTQQLNSDIATHIQKRIKTIADSAEPKSIQELHKLGCIVVKAPDKEVNSGITLMKEFTINVTKNSLNLIKEFRNYRWDEDKKTGELLNKPIKDFDHGIDGVRYGIRYLFHKKNTFFK